MCPGVNAALAYTGNILRETNGTSEKPHSSYRPKNEAFPKHEVYDARPTDVYITRTEHRADPPNVFPQQIYLTNKPHYLPAECWW